MWENKLIEAQLLRQTLPPKSYGHLVAHEGGQLSGGGLWQRLRKLLSWRRRSIPLQMVSSDGSRQRA